MNKQSFQLLLFFRKIWVPRNRISLHRKDIQIAVYTIRNLALAQYIKALISHHNAWKRVKNRSHQLTLTSDGQEWDNTCVWHRAVIMIEYLDYLWDSLESSFCGSTKRWFRTEKGNGQRTKEEKKNLLLLQSHWGKPELQWQRGTAAEIAAWITQPKTHKTVQVLQSASKGGNKQWPRGAVSAAVEIENIALTAGCAIWSWPPRLLSRRLMSS